MKRKTELGTILLSALALILTQVFIGSVQSDSKDPELSRVVFYVSWYDVGEEVLAGLKGVEHVNNGFHDLKETNTVWYDPAVITVDEMERALKKAGTYLGTVK